jgi:hypothetical protein
MTSHKSARMAAALRRTYPSGLPRQITGATRVRLIGGSKVTLSQYDSDLPVPGNERV